MSLWWKCERNRNVSFTDAVNCQKLHSMNGGLRRHVYGALFEWYWQKKTDVLWRKPMPLPVCPPQIPHGLAWDWKQAPAVTDIPQTAQIRTGRCQQLLRNVANKLTAQRRIRVFLNENLTIAIFICCLPWSLKGHLSQKQLDKLSLPQITNNFMSTSTAQQINSTQISAQHLQSWTSSLSSSEFCDWLITSLGFLSNP